MKNLSIKLRYLEELLKHLRETILPKGGDAINEWAKYKAVQIENTLVAITKKGWLKNSAVKDPWVNSYLPTKYEEAAVVVFHEPSKELG